MTYSNLGIHSFDIHNTNAWIYDTHIENGGHHRSAVPCGLREFPRFKMYIAYLNVFHK